MYMSKEADDKLMDQAIDDIDSVELHDESLQESRGNLTVPQYRRLMTIGAFIMNGTSFEEACILSHVDPDNFKLLVESNDFVARYIRVREVAYKASLVRVMVTDARAGNSRNAGWLLERVFKQDYGKNTAADDPVASKNILEEGLAFVRTAGDATPIVKALPTSTPTYSVKEPTNAF